MLIHVKYICRLSLILLAACGLHTSSWACGVSYYGEEYRVALLNPYVIGPEYAAFFYSSNYLYHYKAYHKGIDRRRNCEEWAAYFNGKVDPAEVEAIVYTTNYDALLNAMEGGASPLSVNRFLKILQLPEQEPVLDYLLLAKKYERISSGRAADSWNTGVYDYYYEADETTPPGPLKELKNQVSAALSSVKDPFLKRRYAYQYLVMSRYDFDWPGFQEMYNTYFKSDKSTVLSRWADFHLAAFTDDPARRAFLYAQSFFHCPEKQLACYKAFDKTQAEAALKLAETAEEKAGILALAAIKNPGRALSLIQKIQQLSPGQPALPLLMVREINKLEDWLLTNSLTGMSASVYLSEAESEVNYEWSKQEWAAYREKNRQKDLAYLKQLRSAVDQQGKAKPDQPLWQLLSGHLAQLDKEDQAASRIWNGLKSNGNTAWEDQLLTEKIIGYINGGLSQAPGDLDQLAGWLEARKSLNSSYPEGERDFMALNLMLSQAFEAKGQVVPAYFFNNHSLEMPTAQRWDYGTYYYDLFRWLDWHVQPADIDAILALISKKAPTAFEKYLLGARLPGEHAILDLKGTIALRSADLPLAYEAFSRIPDAYWAGTYDFSYYLNRDPFAWLPDTVQGQGFPASKAELIKEMIDLEKKAGNGEAAAAFRLGTAWYNFSYFGNSWMMFCYGKSIYDQPGSAYPAGYLPEEAPEMEQIYFEASRAIPYLQKALQDNSQAEIKSRAAYLLARIASQRSLLGTSGDRYGWMAPEEIETIRQLEMEPFRDWTEDFAASSTFEQVMATCPELKKYFGK